MTRRDIRVEAEEFLREFHAGLQLPIPIEEILEIKLGIEIRPLPGMYGAFSRNGILLSAGNVIAVDGDDYENNVNRLRFTLAHELGHILLHKDHVASVSVDDVAQAWKQYNGIAPETLGEMERDASYFAGHVLVPQVPLIEQLEILKSSLFAQHGIDITGKGSDVRDTVAAGLALQFNVSTNVVRKRLEEENLP